MDRREFLQRTTGGLAVAGLGAGGALWGSSVLAASGSPTTPSRQTGIRGRIRMEATLQPAAFARSSGEDGRYHALVYEGGGAAARSLLTTPTSDSAVARQLREMGADDGGGVPMSAWNLRKIPLVPWPDTRVKGSPIRILVDWEGWAAPRELGQLLRDPGERGVALRFGGNEELDDEWNSGCIACLFSCPGGVVSNERYTIRDHVESSTRFSPAPDLPADGTPVTATLELLG